MGNPIRGDAAVEDIFKDVKQTVVNALQKKGTWETLAKARLGDVVTLIEVTTKNAETAESAAIGHRAAIAAQDLRADRLLGRIYDDIYNLLDRPGNDPALAILFPGGISYYAEGSVDGQPDRMELLADLMEAGIHKRLPKEKVKAFAKELRDEAAAYGKIVDAARKPLARVDHYARMMKAIARSAQRELASLKREYKAAGFSEAEIHTVIPDRPEGNDRGKSGKDKAAPEPK